MIPKRVMSSSSRTGFLTLGISQRVLLTLAIKYDPRSISANKNLHLTNKGLIMGSNRPFLLES
jgi:hypothetical protein